MNSVMSHPSERQVAVSATKLLINNRWIANESGKTFATIDPATGAEICQVSEGGQSGPGSVRTRTVAQDTGIRARTSAPPSRRPYTLK
jgi:hypothetical protein